MAGATAKAQTAMAYYLTLPNGAHLEHGNVLHEGFHIFQYSANSPGFAYSGDSVVYRIGGPVVSSHEAPQRGNDFYEAGAIVENPQLALWHKS